MSSSYILKKGLSKRSDNLYYVNLGGFSMWKAYCLLVFVWSLVISLLILFILLLFFWSSYITPPAYGSGETNYVNCSFLNNSSAWSFWGACEMGFPHFFFLTAEP